MQVCPSCGESSPDRFTECVFCGTTLAERREAVEERKVLTVVFCDLKDSTGLAERLDPEAVGEVLDLYFTTTTRVLHRHGGSIQKFIGDAVVAAFGIPVVHEDDALRAVRAAIEMREALTRLNRQLKAGYGVELETRMGIHTGEVVVRTAVNDQLVLTGDTLNTAARLEQAAEPDQILIGAPTYRLVRDAIAAEALDPLELKGKADPVPAYRLLSVFGDEQSSRHHNAPMVGREAEHAILLEAFERAVSERTCQLTTVLGEAGVGKSRLVRSLIDAASDRGTVLRGRCPPYGEGITFWPFLAVVREACQIGPDDSPGLALERLAGLHPDPEVSRRVASALGWSREQLPVAELFWGLRELLETLARRQALVIVIDDVHWAAPTLIELVEHLLESVEDAPMLLLCTARPDMLETLPAWSEGPRAQRLILDRLPDDAAAQVIENLVEGVPLPEGLRGMIIRAAEGNPLFVEQLVSMLIESGVLVEGESGFRASPRLEKLEIPPSINALLAARLDLLSGEEQGVVETASVIGLEFSSLAVRQLSTLEPPEQVSVHLADLARRQFVRSSPDGLGELADHRFHHILIRDAAYQRTLKRARADLHERFADWLTQFEKDRALPGEHDEIIGYHLEQAYRYRGQLSSGSGRAAELGSRASARLAAAGRRAFVRGDLPAATSLLSRAVETLAPHDRARLALVPDLAEAMMESGDFDRALGVLGEADESEAAEANPPEVARAQLVKLLIEMSAGPGERWAERARAKIDSSLALFLDAEHHRGMATAWRLAYGVAASALRYDETSLAATRVIEHARAAGDVRQERRASVAYAQSALYGPTPVREAVDRCRELLEAIEGDRRTQALVQLCLAQLEAMQGNTELGRDLYREAHHMLTELGRSVLSVSTSIDASGVELLAGDLRTAEEVLRRDNADLDELGETYLRSTVAGTLARVLVLAGDLDEAERVALEVKEIAADDDIDAQVLWMSALALRRSAQAHQSEALSLADRAVALTQTIADPNRAAQALIDRASVLKGAGRTTDAARDLTGALAIHERKGNVVDAQRVRDLLAELTESDRPG